MTSELKFTRPNQRPGHDCTCKPETRSVHGDSVNDSRPSKYSGHKGMRRRRECGICGLKYTTIELPVEVLGSLSDLILRRIIHDLVDQMGSPSGGPNDQA